MPGFTYISHVKHRLPQPPVKSWVFLFLTLVSLKMNLESPPSGLSFRECAAFLPAASGTGNSEAFVSVLYLFS